MSPPNILQILHEVGAIITDSHFIYTSGRHGSAYVNKDAIYPYIHHVRTICAAMAAPFITKKDVNSRTCGVEGGTQTALPAGGATRAPVIDTVAGPTIGGVILSQWVAQTLGESDGRPVAACYAEERAAADGSKARYFGRGYDRFIIGKRVLIVEDILNTGGSVKLVVDAVRGAGGEPVAVSALCNRGGVQPADIGGVPIHALVNVTMEAWAPEECPLCKQGVPINTTVGKGAKK